jgi:hypothetical protein
MKKWGISSLAWVWVTLATPVPAQPQISPQDVANAQKGMSWDQGHTAKWHLDQQKKLAAAFAAIKPQRSGVIDAYVLSIGLDADPVFGREAIETAKVLTRRYDAAGRSVLLASGTTTAPDGSPPNLAAALAAIAERMDKAEDVLVLYATAHGAPGIGIVYKDGETSYGMVAPERLRGLLDEVGITRRLIIVSACYSGQFVDALAAPDTVVLTAADNDRTSFGCTPSNDWTYFGDALINHKLRTAAKLEPAANDAYKLISEWEFAEGLTSSKPRLFVGAAAKTWLATLEARIPAGDTPRVGRPSVESEKAAAVAGR